MKKIKVLFKRITEIVAGQKSNISLIKFKRNSETFGSLINSE